MRLTTIVQLPESGGIVLIDERKPELSYRLLLERIASGRRVMCITREPPERVRARYPLNGAEHYWLITRGDVRAVSPLRLDTIASRVESFVRRRPNGVILIDGVELLMVMNSYGEVRDLLLRLQGMLQKIGAGCIVPIDTRTLTTGELAELKSSFPMVQGVAGA